MSLLVKAVVASVLSRCYGRDSGIITIATEVAHNGSNVLLFRRGYHIATADLFFHQNFKLIAFRERRPNGIIHLRLRCLLPILEKTWASEDPHGMRIGANRGTAYVSRPLLNE